MAIEQQNDAPVNEVTQNNKIDPELRSLPDKILNFITEKKLEDQITFVVYKKNQTGRGPVKNEFCMKYSEIPDEIEIGSKFGSGNYFVTLKNNANNKFVTTYNFSLNEYFDKLKNEKEEKEKILKNSNLLQFANQNMQHAQPSESKFDMIDMLERLTPLITLFMNNNKNDQFDNMAKAFQSMMEMQMRNFNTLTQRVQTIMLENATITDQNVESPGNEWLNSLMPILQQWLGKLFEPNGMAKKGTQAILNSMSQFQTAKQDPDKIIQLHKYLVGKNGKEFADNALKSIGISI